MGVATERQPDPGPSSAPAGWDLVIADIEADGLAKRPLYKGLIDDICERDAAGEKRYGVRLRPGDGRDHLVDAYQEVLDSVVYSRCFLERPGLHHDHRKRLDLMYRDLIHIAAGIRRVIKEMGEL